MEAETKSKIATKKEAKRSRILEVAWEVFEADGLEGASLRSIAAKAGYTPAALYFHFDSKEALYGELLQHSLERLRRYIADQADPATGAQARFRAATLAFYDFYACNPKDLDLGFYLFRGGLRPKGLGRDLDAALNAALLQALSPLMSAAIEMREDQRAAENMVAAAFAHASGLLLLAHTKRINLFPIPARELMEQFVDAQLADR